MTYCMYFRVKLENHTAVMCLEHVRRTIQLLLIIAGILVSLYAYHVETSKEANAAYQAFCDISDSISCSKVFTSK